MVKMKENISKFHVPRWEELPNIDLYLDQVVNFIEDTLSAYMINDTNIKKEEEASKIITKTMVNNYVKQGLLDAPEKKKYNRKHIAFLFVICILKQVYSISDINFLIKSAIQDKSVEECYNSFCNELENAISLTFFGKELIKSPKQDSKKYLLRNVCQSFASKLYVQNVFLNK
jgi:hypothetical protein